MSSHLLHFTLVRMFALGQVYLNFISALYPLEALFSSDYQGSSWREKGASAATCRRRSD